MQHSSGYAADVNAVESCSTFLCMVGSLKSFFFRGEGLLLFVYLFILLFADKKKTYEIPSYT